VKKKTPPVPKSGYRIRVGWVTPFIVEDADHQVIAAFDSLKSARDHFPTAKIDANAWRKARELGEE